MKLKGASKKHRVCLFVVLLTGLGGVYGLHRLSKATSLQAFGQITDSVNTQQKLVALTFDDAPLEHTPDTLAILRDKQIKATFFVVGKHLEQRQTVARQLVEQGHQLGNHSYSHQRFLFKSQASK